MTARIPALLLVLAAAASAAEPVPARLQRAATARNARRYDEAAQLCEGVLADAQATRKHKLDAFALLVDLSRRRRKYLDAAKILDRLRAAFPEDAELQKTALLSQIELVHQANAAERGLVRADELFKLRPDDKATRATAKLWAARFHYRLRKLDECHAAAAQAIALDPGDLKRVAELLNQMSEAMWAKGDMERCIDATRRVLEPKHLAHREAWQRPQYQKRLCDCLLRLKRYAEARQELRKAEKTATDTRFAQECCYLAARTHLDEKNDDAALQDLERVFVDHPDRSDYWPSAQDSIAGILRSQHKAPEAIAAYRICLDAARDRTQVRNYTLAMAELLRAIDKNLGRANQLINYQRLGPAGPDKKLGTADDLKDPLAAFPRPRYAQREKAFAEARRRAGDTADAARHRAYTCLYTGHPDQALAHFLDAFGRAQGDAFKTIGTELIAVGARAARGHPIDLGAFFDFLNHGPNGPDGRPGTPDDLQDPFAPLLKHGTPK